MRCLCAVRHSGEDVCRNGLPWAVSEFGGLAFCWDHYLAALLLFKTRQYEYRETIPDVYDATWETCEPQERAWAAQCVQRGEGASR